MGENDGGGGRGDPFKGGPNGSYRELTMIGLSEVGVGHMMHRHELI